MVVESAPELPELSFCSPGLILCHGWYFGEMFHRTSWKARLLVFDMVKGEYVYEETSAYCIIFADILLWFLKKSKSKRTGLSGENAGKFGLKSRPWRVKVMTTVLKSVFMKAISSAETMHYQGNSGQVGRIPSISVKVSPIRVGVL